MGECLRNSYIPTARRLSSTRSQISLVGTPTLLRPGGVTLENLRSILGRVDVDPAIYGAHTERPLAPGMKYRHYAPNGAVTVVRGEKESVVRYIKDALTEAQQKTAVLAPDGYFADGDADLILNLGTDAATAAQRLFAALRACDDAGIGQIFAVDGDEAGIGLALCNRLHKAAGFQIIRLEESL